MRLCKELPAAPFKVRMPPGGISMDELGKLLPNCDWTGDIKIYALYYEYNDYYGRDTWCYLHGYTFGDTPPEEFFKRPDNYRIVDFKDVFTTTLYKDE